VDTRTARKLAAARGHKLGRFRTRTHRAGMFATSATPLYRVAWCEHCESAAFVGDKTSPAFAADCPATRQAAPGPLADPPGIRTPEGKRALIESFCNAIRDDLCSKVDRMPEEWDGHELRALVRDAASQIRDTQNMKSRRRGSRGARYATECLVRNLP